MELAPTVYRNWLAYTDQRHCYGADEYAVLTDGHITGGLNRRDEHHAAGPYELINTVHSDVDQTTQIRLVLRVSRFLHPSPICPTSNVLYPIELCDSIGAADDLVALLSLCIGIPLKLGDMMRSFYSGARPEGRPTAFDIHAIPERPRSAYASRMIPSSAGEVNLGIAAPYLSVFPKMAPFQAASLVRAARLYRDALWYSDSMPDMSWLMLSNAIETVAQLFSSDSSTRAVWGAGIGKKLYPLLQELHPSEKQLNQIESVIEELSRATAKFREFIIAHLPPPPSLRPDDEFRIVWGAESMRKILNNIYSFRSKAVHKGIPFRADLCRPPSINGEIIDEYPPPYDGNPKTVHLHIFAYLAQYSILQWWSKQGDKPQSSTTGDCDR